MGYNKQSAHIEMEHIENKFGCFLMYINNCYDAH